jgi:hypothetical protein
MQAEACRKANDWHGFSEMQVNLMDEFCVASRLRLKEMFAWV